MLPTVIVIAGTRPEAIKLAPVIEALRTNGACSVLFLATGQHRGLFDQAIGESGPLPDVDLGLMQVDQSPGAFLARAACRLRDEIAAVHPALVIVQGDTATAYAGAIAAHRLGYPVAHVEAGLRTASIDRPFPEELFRRAIAQLATLHFAPTERARAALLSEGVPAANIHVTGNTGIDRLFRAMKRSELTASSQRILKDMGGKRFGLATVHRRENRGQRLQQIAAGLNRVAEAFDLPIVLPLHPSPELTALITLIAENPLIHLTHPLDHDTMVQLLEQAALLLTDSGGLQEEAATLGTPTIVLRNETERAEALESGRAALADGEPEAIMTASRALLRHGRFPPSELFGDGRAGGRIAQIIADWLA